MISVRKSLLFGAMCMLLIMFAAYSGSHKAIVHWVRAQGLANTGEQVEFVYLFLCVNPEVRIFAVDTIVKNLS